MACKPRPRPRPKPRPKRVFRKIEETEVYFPIIDASQQRPILSELAVTHINFERKTITLTGTEGAL